MGTVKRRDVGRDFDLVLYGATGFVGRLAAAYLARHPQRDRLRLALAGRDRRRLDSLKARLGDAGAAVGTLVADSRDPASVDAAVAGARVVLNVAGPFARYGGPVVDACVRFKTHYADITGETVWVRRLIDRYHERAAADGTRVVPCCGFDSVPSDLGAYLVARHLRAALGADCWRARTYFRLFGGLNGGTVASNAARHESGHVRPGRDPFLLNPAGGRSAEQMARNRDPVAVRFEREIGTWVGPFVMGPVNTRVVRRSAALQEGWGEPYGAGFVYQEYAAYDPPLARLKALAVTGLLGLAEAGFARAPTRKALQAVLPKPGSGPSQRAMDGGWFTAETWGVSADGHKARAFMRHQGDPSNRATVRFACESALALALDGAELPGGAGRGGLLTPATAFGDVLARRLRESGMAIDVKRYEPM